MSITAENFQPQVYPFVTKKFLFCTFMQLNNCCPYLDSDDILHGSFLTIRFNFFQFVKRFVKHVSCKQSNSKLTQKIVLIEKLK